MYSESSLDVPNIIHF